MKLWIKILLMVIIALVFLFISVYLFLDFKGKIIITRQLENLTQKKVNIGYFGLSPLFNLQIKNIEIQGLVKASSISISPSILGFFTGKLVLNDISIVKPELIYERGLSLSTAATPSSATGTESKERPHLALVAKQVRIKDGRLDFIDRTVGEDGIKITIKDLKFNLSNLYVLPVSVVTNFELKGRIPWQEGQQEGSIQAEGWLNLFKKDMQATLKIEDIDGVYLYPYYSKWVDLEKARIEKANLNFTSYIQGLNNDVIAQCRLELTDIVRKPRPPEEQVGKAEKIADAVLDIFKVLNQGKIVLDFTIKTKMDRPYFGFGDIKMAFEDKLAQAAKTDKSKLEEFLMLPAKFIESTVKSATDISKAVIEGTVAVGKEVKKAVTEPFKKEKKE